MGFIFRKIGLVPSLWPRARQACTIASVLSALI